jgi:hypothetical protein
MKEQGIKELEDFIYDLKQLDSSRKMVEDIDKDIINLHNDIDYIMKNPNIVLKLNRVRKVKESIQCLQRVKDRCLNRIEALEAEMGVK